MIQSYLPIQPIYNPIHQLKQSQGILHGTQPTNVFLSTKKLQNINCIEESNQQYGGLYLGDIISMIKPQYMQKYSIGAILSCLSQTNYPCNHSQIPRKIISAKDSLDYPLNIHFEESINFIQQMRRMKKNVLVHCHAGISRSAAIVCAYLMTKNGWSFSEALNFIKKRRNRVKPNENFVYLLKQHQKNIGRKQDNGQKKLKDYSLGIQQNRLYNSRNSFQAREFRQINRNMVDPFNNNSSNRSASQVKLNVNMNPRYSFERPLSRKTKQNQNIQQKKSIFGEQKIDKSYKKQQPSFGQQFKNKVSALLGRNTRIAWELQNKNNKDIEWVEDSYQIGCI